MDTELAFDCPWCAGHLVPAEVAMDDSGDALSCATCSIVVELTSDPVAASVALAA